MPDVRRAPLTPERAGEAAARLAAVAEGRDPHVRDHPVIRQYATTKLRELLEETGGIVANVSGTGYAFLDAEGEALPAP